MRMILALALMLAACSKSSDVLEELPNSSLAGAPRDEVPDTRLESHLVRPVTIGEDGPRLDACGAMGQAVRVGARGASVRAAQTGIYRVTADARRGQTSIGNAGGTVLVGGVDPEMIDPRLNEDALQRVARASGGLVIGGDDAQTLIQRLTAGAPIAALAVRQDLWNTGWSFALIAILLAAEWLTRRYWGLR